MFGDVPRTKLSELVNRIGVGLGDEPRRCDSLLAEACGTAYRDECAALVAAVVHGVTGELQRSSSSPRGTLLDRLSRQLAADAGLSPYLARWTVECWAVALRVVPEDDRLLIVKLEGLARLLDEAAAIGPIGMVDLDRFVVEATRRGVGEGDARAYLAKRLAGDGPPVPALAPAEPHAAAAARLPDPEPRCDAASAGASAGASEPEIADKPMLSATADARAPLPSVVSLRTGGRRQRGLPRILGWGAGLAAAAITAGVFVVATRQHGEVHSPPSAEVPQTSAAERARAEAERQEAERRRLETEAVERGRRQAALAEQQRRQAAEAADRDREKAAAEKRQAELAAREQQAYNAARGSRAALGAYVSTCVLCAFAPDARGQIRRLEAVDEDGRMYDQSRGNLYALQAYVKVCDVCTFKSAANEEISKLEAPPPDIKGIVTLVFTSDWIMVGAQWVHLFGISDGQVHDRSHESYMRRYLEPANGLVECFVRSARRYQCFAAGKDIALQALSDRIAMPERGAPGAYLAASSQH